MKQQRLLEIYEGSPIKQTLKLTLWYDARDRAIFELPYDQGLDNSLGSTHGGILATLLDKAGWFAAAQHYDTWITTTEFQVRLLEPARGRCPAGQR